MTRASSDDNSSSGFSSDDDIMEASASLSAPSHTPSVHVEVLLEAEETDLKAHNSSSPKPAPGAAVASFDILQCCQDAANPILQTSRPLDVRYEEYTAAIGHVTWHWPSSDTVPAAAAVETRLGSYHSLRAELYQTFQQVFPLTEDMYIEWIDDCTARGDSVEHLKTLFELSRRDYWSVPLTLQYLRFIKENGDDQELETAMNRAQKTLGTHFARGHEVWALCRELTIEKYQEMDDGQDTELQMEKAIRDLFWRQMQLPLDQNDLVMSEFRAWDAYNTLDTEASGLVLEAASKRQNKLFAQLMKKLRGFETKVGATPETDDAVAVEQDWLQYLNFIKHRVAPLMKSDKTDSVEGRELVVGLYERAVSVVCLSPAVWASYLEYLESDEIDADEKVIVAQRATRNVPFDSSAWNELLIEMERKGKPVEVISEFVRTKLLARSSSPMDESHLLNVLLTWCDSIRRHASKSIDGKCFEDSIQQMELLIDGVFSECEHFMSKAFPDFFMGKVRLTEYRAKCYWALMPPLEAPDHAAATATKVSKLNELWKKSLSTPLGNQAATWIAYLESIRRTNAFSADMIRTMVFDEAVRRVTDAPNVLAESWLVFERENGDLANYLRARQFHAKHRVVLQIAPAHVAALALSSTCNVGDKKTKNAKKRKTMTDTKQTKDLKQQSPAKRAKLNASIASGEDGAARDVGKVKTRKRAEKKQVHENLTNEYTLFLCNVSKDASKGDIEEVFSDIPTLKDVRLVVKMRGDRVKSRGIAYVQFTDDAGIEAGLQKDGFLLHGHPLRVERSKPPATSASTGAGKPVQESDGFWKTDPLTLYVGNLNREGSKDQVTEKQLETLLQQTMQSAGKLVVVNRVSILKDRHDKLKNYGLVEVAEPSQVAFCLSNVGALQEQLGDQVTLKPSRFSIAHILEQQEKQKQQRKPRSVSSGNPTVAAKNGANVPHARPSTRLTLESTSLMPRALRRKPTAQQDKVLTTETTTIVAPKSNEDFRKMLFNK